MGDFTPKQRDVLCHFDQRFLGLCSALIKMLMQGVSELPQKGFSLDRIAAGCGE
jgi:hypothetical protein